MFPDTPFSDVDEHGRKYGMKHAGDITTATKEVL
jgi:hypothetical protein